MKKFILFLFISVFLFASCKDNRYFRVEGKINDGKNHVIYLEHLSPDKIRTIDSFVLKSHGYFHFKKEHPAYPDFYRVRIDDEVVTFAIDSSETVVIRSEDPNFKDYTITGSKNIEKISELNRSIKRVEKAIKAYEESFDNDNIANNHSEISKLIAQHDSLAQKIIYCDTKSSAAYHAIFHKVAGSRFYHISNDRDLKLFVAVATAYNAHYPHSIRSKELTDLVQQARRLKRSEDIKQLLLKNSHVSTVMDIKLPNTSGDTISLSDFRGKVVLVNFAYYKADYSMEYVMGSRDQYIKYHDKGFEMVGVSFDGDTDLFKEASKRVPWIRLFDEKGLNSDLLETYDIIQLPTLFLLDQSGNIVSRHTYLDSTLKENLEMLLNR